MIGLILVVLSLLVLFHIIPGELVAWLIVLICGVVLFAATQIPSFPPIVVGRRRE